MPDTTPLSSTGAPPRQTVDPHHPGVPPLVPVLAPLVIAAIVLGGVFTRYLSSLAPVRPIPNVRFVDMTEESGLSFTHLAGTSGELSPTTLGSGVAVLDYNRDGAPDLFFVNGSSWPWQEEESTATCALYRNDGAGHFRDVTAEAGLALRIQGMGVAFGDYDADGWPDLFVSGVGDHRLYHNQGDGTFLDVTETAGVTNDGRTWSMGALWFDANNDGRLDLLVANYVRWPREIDLEVAFKIAGVGRSYGAPAGFVSASPSLYLNRGNGQFSEDAEGAGLRNLAADTRLPRAETLGVGALDANVDGKLDLLFFHHAGEPTLYLNQGGGKYREWTSPAERQEGATAGVVGLNAMPLSRMNETPALTDVARQFETPSSGGAIGLGAKLGFALFDYDLDGRVDILSGGGRAEPELNRFDAGRRFEGAPTLHWNRGENWVAAPFAPEGLDTTGLLVRGVVTGDFDRDGDPDLVVTQNGGPARLFRNDQRLSQAWLRVDLNGRASGRDGTGARVEVHTPRLKLVRTAVPAMGFLSQSETSLRFGLGEDARVRRIVVIWPSGVRQEVVPEGINRVVTITEP